MEYVHENKVQADNFSPEKPSWDMLPIPVGLSLERKCTAFVISGGKARARRVN